MGAEAVVDVNGAERARQTATEASGAHEAAQQAHSVGLQRLQDARQRLANSDRDRTELLRRLAEGDDDSLTAEIQQLDVVRDSARLRVESLELFVLDLAAQLEESRATAQEAAAAAEHLTALERFDTAEMNARRHFDKFAAAFTAASVSLGEFLRDVDEANAIGREQLGPVFTAQAQRLLELVNYPNNRIVFQLAQQGYVRKPTGFGHGWDLVIMPLVAPNKENSNG